MGWHVAGSLEQLLTQVNAHAPNRSRASDGAIGDAAHATRDSDHNPWYRSTVTARDFSHDPGGGLDCNWLAGRLIASRDARIKYIIWQRRILAGNEGPEPWMWRPYSGTNPHTKHLHVSVVASPFCEDRREWDLSGAAPTSIGGRRNLFKGATGVEVIALQKVLTLRYPAYARFPVTGYFGPDTEAAVREFQRRSGLTVDGVAGPNTLAALGL